LANDFILMLLYAYIKYRNEGNELKIPLLSVSESRFYFFLYTPCCSFMENETHIKTKITTRLLFM